MQIQVQNTDNGMITMIAPTTMTTQGYEQIIGRTTMQDTW
jgi:hypothetical protein